MTKDEVIIYACPICGTGALIALGEVDKITGEVTKYDPPVIICPNGHQEDFDPEPGEVIWHN
jgi:hypothetical protein